ncbi:F-box/LRR-repeat protein [Corchorus capsularis]|uniref:F-box/LRR-repeat protein n=1 Tax=Corchorus capsularis TaxID=210143 RepID=A0A1R3HE24_COCAP|nr:F-box/LRR-repeat protein [Corchorus capsularis]
MEPYLMQLDSVLSIPTSSFNVQNRFKSLRQLVLKFVDLTDELFETILSGCTSLECLYLLHSRRLVNLKHTVPHLKLKCLEIYRCFNLEKMEIFAPNLVTFKYLGPIINICIKDAKQLINVRLDTSRPYGYPDKNSLGLVNPQRTGFVFGQFAGYLSQLEYLRMNVSCFELGVPACYQTASYFLKASPFLHRLELNFQLPPDGRQALTRIPISEHKYLKEVFLSGFFGDKIVMDFIMDIVDCTIALERIDITTCYLDGIMMTGGPISVMALDDVARVKTSIRELRRRLPQYVQLNFLDDC